MKNRFEVRGDYVVIYAKNKYHGEKEIYISTSDLPKAQEISGNWFVVWLREVKGFYCRGLINIDGKDRIVQLHRFLTGAKPDIYVDHINHNTLDNRRDNLRLVTNSQNQQNRLGANVTSTSGYRGVHYYKPSGKWRAVLRVNGKVRSFGYYDTPEEANKVVTEARRKYMPYSLEAYFG